MAPIKATAAVDTKGCGPWTTNTGTNSYFATATLDVGFE